MQNFVQPVNVEALRRAAEAIVGPQVTDTILRTYQAIDQAMFAGYQLGQEDATESVDERLDDAFDAGYAAAEQDYELDASDAEADDAQGNLFDYAYDEGYVSGVADARARPTIADRNVQDIINDGAEEHYEALAEAVQDEA